MAASRDKWMIAVFIVTMAAVAATVFLFVTEQNRDTAITELRAKLTRRPALV